MRNLVPSEISKLQYNGNTCVDWSSVLVVAELESLDVSRIRNCSFKGSCIIGIFEQETFCGNGIWLMSGLYDSNFIDCYLDDDCLVTKSFAVRNTFVGKSSAVINCTYVTSNGLEKWPPSHVKVCVGAETGGRPLRVTSALSYSSACNLVLGSADERARFNSRNTGANDITNITDKGSAGSAVYGNVIGRHCLLTDCKLVDQCDIGDFCWLNGCSEVKHCILSSHNEYYPSTLDAFSIQRQSGVVKVIPTMVVTVGVGSTVCNSLLHPNSSVELNCIVHCCVLFDCSSVSERGIVHSSILGPDCSIAVAEVHHSLLGPMIGLHHTSLCIAALWPQGRGNVAYGAMIGANHTGRVNDQECVLGEGVFFGLGSSVKFPINLLHSPYSILAAGTPPLTPQVIKCPFSLISASIEAANTVCIKPGWVLTANPYLLERSQHKFSVRGKSKSTGTCYPLLRPCVIKDVIEARNRLLAYAQYHKWTSCGQFPATTSTNAPGSGCGHCVLTSVDCLKAVVAYTNTMHQYALQGVLAFLISVTAFFPTTFHEVSFERVVEDCFVRLFSLTSTTDDNPAVEELFDRVMNTLTDIHHHQLNVCLVEGLLRPTAFRCNGSCKEQSLQCLSTLLTLQGQYVHRIKNCRVRDFDKRDDVLGEGSWESVHDTPPGSDGAAARSMSNGWTESVASKSSEADTVDVQPDTDERTTFLNSDVVIQRAVANLETMELQIASIKQSYDYSPHD